VTTQLDIPRTLPADLHHLSASSISEFWRCPELWYRKRILRDYVPPASGAMVLGSAVSAAETGSYQHQVDEGERLPTEDTLDLFADEWEERTQREEIDWRDDEPGKLKDHGVKAVQIYDQTIAPNVTAVSTERPFSVSIDGVDWTYDGYLDLEEADGAVSDLKVKGKKLGQGDADSDIQPTSYLLARRAEGNPAPGFRFHTMVRTKVPYAEVVETERTDAQLDTLVESILSTAAEINWRLETDNWRGAVPGSWWCGEKWCGLYPTCRFGGAK